MIVLSKFWILTVVSVTSVTYPSAPYFSIVIQSPGRSMSLAESCTPATSPRMLSRKISITIAAEAPSPARIVVGSRPIRMLTIRIAPTQTASSLTIW